MVLFHGAFVKTEKLILVASNYYYGLTSDLIWISLVFPLTFLFCASSGDNITFHITSPSSLLSLYIIMGQICLPYHKHCFDSNAKTRARRKSVHYVYLSGEELFYSYEVIFQVWNILRLLGKWQCLEEQKENMLSPFENGNVGTTFSFFPSGWPLSISDTWPFLPLGCQSGSGRGPVLRDLAATSCKQLYEATSITSKEITGENFVVKTINTLSKPKWDSYLVSLESYSPVIHTPPGIPSLYHLMSK